MRTSPKLLHELEWTRRIRKFPLALKTDPKIKRIAELCGYTILADACGRYNIVPSNLEPLGPFWFNLDPITAQAVLMHIQQSPLIGGDPAYNNTST
jgi:hypothetical protein